MADMTGRCLCGAVTYRVSAVTKTDACHCGMCRRWAGGPAFAFEPKDIAWQGEEAITVYRSSDWAERGFCSKCGTNLFYRVQGSGEHFVNTFTLDEPGDLDFTVEVFVDDQPGFYSFTGERKRMTGDEVVAAFAASKS